MTLAELKAKAEAVKIGGRLPLDNAKMPVYQEMVFDFVTQLCAPLNLAIPYQDRDIYRFIEEDEAGVEWFVKQPRIALDDADYIDIDSRLDMAFVYALAAFMAADADRVLLEQKAERICVEYACASLKMGLPKAKEVYEQERFVQAVQFDCVGRVYTVDAVFVDTVIACLLCGNVCMNAAQARQLDAYRRYLADTASVQPVEMEALRALDAAVFTYLVNHAEKFAAYGDTALSRVTTLYCEFEKLAQGKTVEPWVQQIDTRLGRA